MRATVVLCGMLGSALLVLVGHGLGFDGLALARLAVLGAALGALVPYDLAEHRIPNRIVLPAAALCGALSIADLIGRGASGEEVYEVVCALARHRRTLGRSVPDEREREMFWLRAVEGLTLKQIGERFGVIAERVRQLHAVYFGLHSPPPATKGRSSRGRRD